MDGWRRKDVGKESCGSCTRPWTGRMCLAGRHLSREAWLVASSSLGLEAGRGWQFPAWLLLPMHAWSTQGPTEQLLPCPALREGATFLFGFRSHTLSALLNFICSPWKGFCARFTRDGREWWNEIRQPVFLYHLPCKCPSPGPGASMYYLARAACVCGCGCGCWWFVEVAQGTAWNFGGCLWSLFCVSTWKVLPDEINVKINELLKQEMCPPRWGRASDNWSWSWRTRKSGKVSTSKKDSSIDWLPLDFICTMNCPRSWTCSSYYRVGSPPLAPCTYSFCFSR